jgi:ATP-dependent DNA ligase
MRCHGVAVFDALHRRRKVTDAILFAFDLIELNGEDFRPLPLLKRSRALARLLAHVAPGIEFTSTPTQTAPRCSGTSANWGWRGSCRNG